MQTEISSGIVPLIYKKDFLAPLVFVIKHRYGQHWGFPKGHCQIKETYLQTACRELFEETGLSINRLLSVKPLIQNYTYSKNSIIHRKKVFYFMALVKGKVFLQKEEVLEGKWVSFSEAISLFSFENSKDIAYKTANFLKITL